MKRVRQRVKELTPRAPVSRDLREVIAQLNPVLRGWGNYFRTGNAASKFNQVDDYVELAAEALARQAQGPPPSRRSGRPMDAATSSTPSVSIACAAPSSTRRLRNAALPKAHR